MGHLYTEAPGGSMADESDERKFLHDIASPIGVALFAMDSVLESLTVRPGTPPEDLIPAKQVYDALERTRKMLEARRAVLIARGAPKG